MARESQEGTVSFLDFAREDYKKMSGYRKYPDGITCFFGNYQRYQGDASNLPMLGVDCVPTWIDRMYTRIRLFGLDGSYATRLGEKNFTRSGVDHLRTFNVYDLDITRLDDPTYTPDPIMIEPHMVKVYRDTNVARTEGSLVVDPGLRQRIREYALADDSGLKIRNFINKYWILRRAPFVTSNFPGGDSYTYQGVVEDVTSDTEKTAFGVRPRTFRRFTPEDLEWLKTYMRNKGLEIPEVY